MPPVGGAFGRLARPVIVYALAIACGAAPVGESAKGPPQTPGIVDTVVQSGLTVPWDVAFAPDGRMFVTERPGNLIVFESGAPKARRLATTAIPGIRAMGEAGLMGLALDPDFASDHYVYVCASRADEGDWRNQVLRYRAVGNVVMFDSYVVRTGIRAAATHNGCSLRFGPDGKLWVTTGDASVGARAQDPASLNGKVLRVNPDGSVPGDNPIINGSSARTTVYTLGHRNPQGISFHPDTGRAYLVDQGATSHDEINLLEPGGNYGWPTVEGPGFAGRGFVDPIWSSGNVTFATSGATFVSGKAWGSWSGSLFVATLKESDLRRFVVVEGSRLTPKEVLLDQKYGRLRTPVLAPDGSLYVTTSNGGDDRIVRLTPTAP